MNYNNDCFACSGICTYEDIGEKNFINFNLIGFYLQCFLPFIITISIPARRPGANQALWSEEGVGIKLSRFKLTGGLTPVTAAIKHQINHHKLSQLATSPRATNTKSERGAKSQPQFFNLDKDLT